MQVSSKLVAHPKASHELARPFNPIGFVQPTLVMNQLNIAPGMKVADFGAGSGAYTLATARLVGKSGAVFAIDVQKELLARIKNAAVHEGFTNVDVIWGSIEAIRGTRLASDSVDVVIVSNVLFQTDHKQNVFTEAARILKVGGRIAVVEWSEASSGGPPKEHVVSPEQIRAYAASAGLLHTGDFDAGSHHVGLLFKKKNPLT